MSPYAPDVTTQLHMSTLDLAAPIEPLIGVGPLKLLDNVFTIRQLMLNSLTEIVGNSSHQGQWELGVVFPDWNRFSYQNTVHIYSLIYTGLIVRIELTGAYQGKVQGIGIGSTVSQVLAAFATASFDEDLIEVVDLGLAFTIDATDGFDDLADVVDNRVTSIKIDTNQQELALKATRLVFVP
jgi:hypothetical protein